MIKTVISDLGRVLIHFDNGIFIRKIAQFCPLTEEEITKMMFKELDLIEAFDKGELTPKEFYNRVIQRLKAAVDYDHFFSIYNDVFSLNSTPVEVLKKLIGRYTLVLLSNTDVMRFGFIGRKFPEVMFFDEYVLSFEVGSMKPQPQVYRVVLERSGSRAEECVFIDDREENVEAARALGIKGILFSPQTDLESALKEIGLSF